MDNMVIDRTTLDLLTAWMRRIPNCSGAGSELIVYKVGSLTFITTHLHDISLYSLWI
jgi:hypothetical protein